MAVVLDEGTFVNPFKEANHCFRLSWPERSEFIVLADQVMEGIETVANYFLITEPLPHFIKTLEESCYGHLLPINEGEYYVERPFYKEIWEPRLVHTITWEEWDDEDKRVGETDKKGVLESDVDATLREIYHRAKMLGIDFTDESMGWLVNRSSPEIVEFFEKGIEKFYHLHIKGCGHNNRYLLDWFAHQLQNR